MTPQGRRAWGVITPKRSAILGAVLADWTRERLANYKVPRLVQVVDAPPMNAAGKVLQRELRAQFATR